MFERYTERARQVVVLAQDEARALKHDYIGTEHLLLGLIREEGGVGARVLASLDVTLDRAREGVIRVVGTGEAEIQDQIPFTPRAKKVLELTLREALGVGSTCIGTEHILLGLLREGDGVAIRVLVDMSLDAEKIRNEVMRVLGPPTPRSQLEQEFIVIPKGCAHRVVAKGALEAARIAATHDATLSPDSFDDLRAWEVIGPDGATSYIQTQRSREHQAWVDESEGSSG